MTKRQIRDETERLSEAEAKVARLKAKIAKKEAKENPLLAPLASALEDTDKALLAERKGFSTGPQSFEVRLRKHELWIEEIKAAEVLANARAEYLSNVREHLKSALNDIVLSSSQDEDFDIAGAVANALSEVPSTPAVIETLESELSFARNLRLRYDEEVKTPKRKTIESSAS